MIAQIKKGHQNKQTATLQYKKYKVKMNILMRQSKISSTKAIMKMISSVWILEHFHFCLYIIILI